MFSLNDPIVLWNNFFFEEIPNVNVALLRIFWGLIYLMSALVMYKDYELYFSERGVYHSYYWRASGAYKTFNIFKYIGTSDSYIKLVFFTFCVSSMMMIVGLFSTFSIFMCYFLWTSLNHRCLYIFHSGDGLLRLIGFLLIFSNAGEAVSLDNYYAEKEQLSGMGSGWAQKLMMIQFSLVYIKSVINKLNYGWSFWYGGVALHYVLRNRAMIRNDLPRCLKKGPIILFASWLTVLSQIFVGVGLWFKETVCYAFFSAVVMHVCFGVILNLGFFSHTVISCLILFVDPDSLQQFLEACVSYLQSFKIVG